MAVLPAALLALSLASCDVIDEVLEGEAPAENFLRIAWPLGEIPAVSGETRDLKFSIARMDDYDHAVHVAVSGLPPGITASVSSVSSGDIVNATISLTVAPTVPIGLRTFTLRVGGERLKEASRTVTLRILNPPSYTLDVTPDVVEVVRGGAIPVTVGVIRENYSQAVTLQLQSDAAITATFAPQPVTGATTTATLEVGDDVAPGSYTVTFLGDPVGDTPVSASLEVVVLSEALQIVASDTLETLQGRSVRRNFILNARSTVEDVVLSATGLPSGVEAAFTPVAGREHAITLSVSPEVAATTYEFTVVASAPGVADATAPLVLVVEPSSVSVATMPAGISVFQGARAQGQIALTRVSLDTTVAITIEGLPAGLEVTVSPALLTDDVTDMTFIAAENATTGTHAVTVVAHPSGWPAAAAVRHVVHVAVRPAPASDGNVYLDWEPCGSPIWLAVQDGFGPWVAAGTAGSATRVSITQGRGGIAWVRGDSLIVRYQTTEEFTDFPENLCPPPRYTRTATGSGVHQNAAEQYVYAFGNASALSSASKPAFTMSGIAPGIHDLVVWGTQISPSFEPRGLIRRNVDIPDGGSLGAVDITGDEGFTPARANISASSASSAGFLTAHMGYLTRETCSFAHLYSLNLTFQSGSWKGQLLGVPAARQQPRDLHIVTLTATTPTRVTSLAFTFHELGPRSASMPQLMGAPFVSDAPAPYRRLQIATGPMASAYNRGVIFEYSGGRRHVIAEMTRGYSVGSNMSVGLPDFTGVSGWQDGFAPPPSSSVQWEATYRGGSLESRCAPGYAASALRFTGSI